MPLAKVGRQVVDGLKEKQNFLNMVRDVLDKYECYGVISKTSKGVHSRDNNSFQYTYKRFGLNLSFFHSRAKFYFLINDPEKKCRNFERMDIWPQYAIIGTFDLNIRRSFSLETSEQVMEIHKCFESCFEKIDRNTQTALAEE